MKNIVKKMFILFLTLPLFVLNACVPPWASKIVDMKVTWESETPYMQFTVSQDERGFGFGYIVDSNGEEREICFCWAATAISFLIYLTNSETDIEKIISEEENLVLMGRFNRYNKKQKSVKLTIDKERDEDKLFNFKYTEIILFNISE